MSIVCWLFGHREQVVSEGYRQCKRCGQHEYWDNPITREGFNIHSGERAYNEAGVLKKMVSRLLWHESGDKSCKSARRKTYD